MWRTIGIDQSRGRGGEEGHYQPRRAKGPQRRPVSRRPGSGSRKAHHQQVRWHGDGVRPKAGRGICWEGADENAEGGDTGGVRSVINYFLLI